MASIHPKTREQHPKYVASSLRILLAIGILLLLVYFCNQLVIIGFVLLGIAPVIFVRFILMQARDSQVAILTSLGILAIATLYLTRINWIGVTFFAGLCTTLIIIYYPQLAKSDDDLLYNYSMLFLLTFGVGTLIHAILFHHSPLKSAYDFIQLTLNSFQATIENATSSLSPEQAKELKQQWETMRSYIPYYFYGTIFTFYVLVVFLTLRNSYYRFIGEDVPSLFRLRIKERYAFVLIFALSGEIIGKLSKLQSIFYVSRSVLIFTGIIYFFVGLLVAVALLEQHRSKSFVTYLIPILILTLILLNPLIGVIIGVLDIWFDFRKLGKPKDTEAT